jgi:hypothetical protein
MKLPLLKHLPKNDPIRTFPPFPSLEPGVPQPNIEYQPRSNFYVMLNEDHPIGIMVDNDPIMVYIDITDGGKSEPRKMKINDIVLLWIKETNRVPVTIEYGDFTYNTETEEFDRTKGNWRPIRGQEDWVYDGGTFNRIG